MGRTAYVSLVLAVVTSACSTPNASDVPAAAGCPSSVVESAPLPAPWFNDGPPISADDLVSDFDNWLSRMRSLNPEPAVRADLGEVEREAARIRARLTAPMSQREAWIAFAQMNPHLRDAHSGVLFPNYRGALADYIARGGRIVPIEVRFASDGSLRVFGGRGSFDPGARIHAINGRSAGEIARAILAVTPGETPVFRRAWAARRFPALYWLLYGDTGAYDIAVKDASGCVRQVRVDGATTLPPSLQTEPATADLFQRRIIEHDIGYLRIDSFDGGNRAALASFTQEAFAYFRKHDVRALIIDVRENGGGDDPLWQESVMEFITTTPYAQLSRYAVRITADNADPGDVIGDVQRSEYTRRITPNSINADRFSGPVYILVGPLSYSATIQFAVAAQDFGVARIAGEETGALSCQTGQVRSIDMPRSGLNAFTPIISFTRPSGVGCEAGVIPDVPIAIDELSPERTLDQLVRQIVSARSADAGPND